MSDPARARPLVYLAGPTVFLPDPEALFRVMRSLCEQAGLEGISPLDGQAGLTGVPPGPALTRRIVEADIGLMERVDGALVCLDGFRRSPEMDPGAAFEVGWLAARGKPMCGWTQDLGDYPEKVARYFRTVFGLELAADAAGGPGGRSGVLRDPDGMLVHSAGCAQNAMVHIGITRGGGVVDSDADWRKAFASAARTLAARLAGRATA